jgi:hypothetical protein
LLQEEREKRNQLEDKVAVLMERLEALENKWFVWKDSFYIYK